MDDKKIIPFPLDKVKKPARPASQNETKAPGDKRRVMLMMSVASVFVLATVWFEKLNRPESSSGDRFPANQFAGPSRNMDEEMNLARRISRESIRQPASQGRKPNLEDKLRIEELAGRYAVSFQDGALIEIQYKSSTGEDPVYLNERDKFLMKHKDLLRISFHSVKLHETIKDKEGKTEVYELVGEGEAGEEIKAMVHFRFDKPERFHSMKVESRNRSVSSE